MKNTDTADHLKSLLAPLYEAGWQDMRSALQDRQETDQRRVITRVLQRSCMVVGIEYVAAAPDRDELRFVPVTGLMERPDDGVGPFDAVPDLRRLQAVSHGLLPVTVEHFAASLGLLDPTRFEPPERDSHEQVEFLARLYLTYVGRAAAKWCGGPMFRALKALDADEAFTDLVKTLMHLAPNVVPDPVPMAAAIGLTLDCWRNTELENLHAGSKTLTDVVIAKLNIATTRAVRQYITTKGIDWEGVGGVLLDPERRCGTDSGDRVSDLLGADWPVLRQSIEAKLDHWMHIEQIAGPEATLRLSSVMGSTPYTERWWGNGWWPDYSGSVLWHVQRTVPDALTRGAQDFDPLDAEAELRDGPERLPDWVLAALIDLPDGNGLRHHTVPDHPLARLTPPDLESHAA